MLTLSAPTDRRLRLLALGAHPDDIEIGAGATLLQLSDALPSVEARYTVLTGTQLRQDEARHAAAAFLPTADLTIDLHDLPEGRLPVHWGAVKEVLESIAREFTPDVILAPSHLDAHQDHRTLAEIIPTVFRNGLYLAYEIPKWDGDIWRPSIYVGAPVETMQRKVRLLAECFPSQQGRDWWDDELFFGFARTRGMESKNRYAEAFGCNKATISLSGSPPDKPT